MIDILVKWLVKFIASETMKEVVKYGANELVKRTDTGIDDALADNLLGNIEKSTKNSVKDVMIKEAKGVLKEKLGKYL